MDTNDSSIVMSNVPKETILSEHHYDPSVRFILPTKREQKGTPVFSLEAIVAQFNKNHEDVRHITLPVVLFTRNKNNTQPEVIYPAMWETRCIYNDVSWSVMIGTRTGQRVGGKGVVQVRYPSSPSREVNYQTGRRTLVLCSSGTLMTFVFREQFKETYLTYMVNNVLDWPKACKIFQPTPDQKNIASANLTLVGAFVISRFDEYGSVWYDKNMTEEQIAGIVQMRAAALDSLVNPEESPRYIEHFVSANPSSSPRKNIHTAPEGSDISILKTDAENFVATLHHHLNDYRRALLIQDHKDKNLMIPMNATYTLVEDDLSVMVNVEVPSQLNGYPHFAVEALFTELPYSFIVEPGLTYGTNTFIDFVKMVNNGGHTKPLFSRT